MYYLKADIEQPVNLISAGNFIADNNWKHSERVISDYEIIIAIRNTVYIQQDETEYVLHPGDALLLLPGHVHKGYEYSEKGTSFYWFHFSYNSKYNVISVEDADAIITLINNNSFYNGLSSDILIPAFLKTLNLERITVLFHQILDLLKSHYYTSQGINCIVTTLLIELTEQNISRYKNTNRLTSPDKLQKIQEWIRIHYTQDISLANVAHEFNYSKEYLARYFKHKMGMSMQQYIYNLKLSKAKELLCESDKSVKEISKFLGFNDEKYFMKLFKRFEDTTPKQFRNAYNKTHLNNV